MNHPTNRERHPQQQDRGGVPVVRRRARWSSGWPHDQKSTSIKQATTIPDPERPTHADEEPIPFTQDRRTGGRGGEKRGGGHVAIALRGRGKARMQEGWGMKRDPLRSTACWRSRTGTAGSSRRGSCGSTRNG